MKTVVLCGGSGTRLWPISRKTTPKQFARIFKGKSLYEKTLERNRDLSDSFLIVVNRDQLDLCKDQSQTPTPIQFLAESVGRNTAPAIAFAAFNSDPDEILLVLPSDHLIKDLDAYQERVREAKSLAEQGYLATFGIRPSYPETGYGYIEAKGSDVQSFKEKPNKELAQKYVDSGQYFWNSGMFCFKAGVFLLELKEHSPEIFSACEQAWSKLEKGVGKGQDSLTLSRELLEKVPSDSIDYAVMEKSSNVKMVAANFQWSDMGSFDSLYEELETDESGNTLGEGLYALDSKNNLIIGDKRVIATFDVENLIVVDTPDALLIGKRGQSQKVKELLGQVQADHPELAD